MAYTSSRARINSIWHKMKGRCYDIEHNCYANYGGRGITICNEWLNSFGTFHDWAINTGYSDSLSIDRIDNDKGYSPENCKWSTKTEQDRNRRTTVYLTAFGETKCISDWVADSRCVVNATQLRSRIKFGIGAEPAMTAPVRSRVTSDCGSRRYNAKLTETDAAEIRRRAMAGDTDSSIAKDFNVSRMAVWFVRTGNRWAEGKDA